MLFPPFWALHTHFALLSVCTCCGKATVAGFLTSAHCAPVHIFLMLQDLVSAAHPTAPLSAGTFGEVHQGSHPAFGDYVIKVPTDASDWDMFEDEAKNLSLFCHPNIVQYFGRFWQEGWPSDRVPGIIMERLQTDLSTYLYRYNSSLSCVRVL